MEEKISWEKDHEPQESDIKNALKSTYTYLQEIREYIKENIGETREEWKYYGKKHGWELKTFLKKRNLFFIGIYDGYFRVTFVFGKKAVEAVQDSDVSDKLKKELAEARKYGEGRGLAVVVKNDSHLEDIKKLINIKHNN